MPFTVSMILRGRGRLATALLLGLALSFLFEAMPISAQEGGATGEESVLKEINPIRRESMWPNMEAKLKYLAALVALDTINDRCSILEEGAKTDLKKRIVEARKFYFRYSIDREEAKKKIEKTVKASRSMAKIGRSGVDCRHINKDAFRENLEQVNAGNRTLDSFTDMENVQAKEDTLIDVIIVEEFDHECGLLNYQEKNALNYYRLYLAEEVKKTAGMAYSHEEMYDLRGELRRDIREAGCSDPGYVTTCEEVVTRLNEVMYKQGIIGRKSSISCSAFKR